MRILIVLFFGFQIISNAQIITDVSSVVKKKIVVKPNDQTSIEILESTKINIKELVKSNGTNMVLIQIPKGTKYRFSQATVSGEREAFSDETYLIKYEDTKDLAIAPSNLKGFWDGYLIKSKVYDKLLTRGFQNDLRADLEADALNYLSFIRNRLYKDEFIDDYIYRLISKFYPFLPDGRTGHINVQIEINPNPNAAIFPNGTMILTTGLFSNLNSDKELMAVLAHEISHFMLDHSVDNINAIQKKEKKALFWAGVATAAAAATEVYMAADQGIDMGGSLTLSTAIIAYSVGQEVVENFGYKYSREQELEADDCAASLLKFIGEDPRYLSNVLKGFQKYNSRFGIDDRIYKESSHPSLADRIMAIGEPVNIVSNSDYNYTISRLNTFNSSLEFLYKHFSLSEELIQRNIESNVATQDDYITKARIILFRFDSSEKNIEALSYVEKAKTITANNRDELYKLEGIIQLRLKKREQALAAFKEYSKRIEKRLISPLTLIKGAAFVNYLEGELNWTTDMIYKCS